MKFVFADTGYWVAVIDPDDILHQRALRVSRLLLATVLVTTELVLAEVLNHFSDYGRTYRQTAATTVQQAYKTVSVVRLADTPFEKALALYAARTKNGALWTVRRSS